MSARLPGVLFALCLACAPALAEDAPNPLQNGETWTDLRGDVVGDRELLDGSALFEVDAPYRAHDAAVVPVRIVQAEGSQERITRLTIIVDENPAPVVAELEFGPSMGRLELETRVRVDRYSNVRAIAETADGRLWMSGRFVKGAGGCSAPALKDMEAALASAGQMRMKLFGLADASAEAVEPAAQSVAGRREAQVMIRHPNYSGMQRNQITQLFIPAYFVHELDIYLGDERLIHMEGGISVSEDPTFRFSYDPNGATSFRVQASDTDGGRFEENFPAETAG